MSENPAIVPGPDPEKLAMAAEDLARLTPESYLNLREELATIVEASDLHEAPASINCRLYGGHGGEIQITIRALSGARAWDELVRTIRYITTDAPEMGWSPARPQAPTAQAARQPAPVPAQAGSLSEPPPIPPSGPQVLSAPAASGPTYVPVADSAQSGAEVELVPVATIKHAVTESGKHFIKVKGAEGTGYSQYGVSAWPEALPHDIKTSFETWSIGQEYNPPAHMAVAQVVKDANGRKKVRAFSPAG